MFEYEKLLERGIKKIPEKKESEGRFEIPKANVLISGARTIITNFLDIAKILRREEKHLLKFLLRELATSGNVEDKKLIVIGRFSENLVNKKIEIYVKNYVICPACGKPDTKIIEEGKILKCEACGARTPIKPI